MRNSFLKLYVKTQTILASVKNGEEGQDLIEYALVVALIAFAATVGMHSLASGINSAFVQVSSILGSYIT